VAVIATTAIGALQGLITIVLKAPSFIVTLAGSLFWKRGLYLIDDNNAGGTIPTQGGAIHDIVNSNLTPLVTWIFTLWCRWNGRHRLQQGPGATSQWTR